MRYGFVALTVALGVLVVVERRREIERALSQIGVLPAVLALVAVCLALTCAMQVFRVVLVSLGSRLPARAAAQVVFVGQLGKYVPGSVWPVLAQMELAASHRVPRARTATATVMMMPISLLTGLVLGAVTLPLQASGADRFHWAFLAAPLVVVLLHPAILNRLLALALRVLGRPTDELVVDGRRVLLASGWGLLQWVFYGLQIWLLVLPLGGRDLRTAVVAVGAFAFAWCAGFLFVLAPAGAGVREVVLVALLSPLVGVGPATAVALLSRAVLTVADLLTAGVGAVAGRRTLRHVDAPPG